MSDRKLALLPVLWTILLSILSVITVTAQPIANFKADTTKGCSPQLIQFTDLSTGNIASWSWDIGGVASTLQNPARIFANGGFFDVCLTVTDQSGLTSQKCLSNYVEIYQSPKVTFLATPDSGCAPLFVQFTDQTIPGNGNITSWSWGFGGGPTSSAQNPSHIYPVSGTYDVTLIVNDDKGCTDFVKQTDFIHVLETPIADFSVDVNSACTTPLTVQFTNQTNDPNAQFTYNWNFGDGSPNSTLTNPSHTYTTKGDYTVILIATNPANGCSDTLVLPNFIRLQELVNFGYNPAFGCGSTTIQFTDSTAGNAANWQWDFGDGTTIAGQQNPTHTYSQPGCYFVTLTASSDSCQDTKTSSQCIRIYPDFNASYSISDNASCYFPFTTNFSGIGANVQSWEWDFGGAGTSNLQNPQFTFSNFGTYPIQLIAENMNGCRDTILLDTVMVEPIEANFSINTNEGCVPLTVQFSDSSSSVDQIVSWNWDFGFTTATGPNPSVTFLDTLPHSVTLVITTSTGCTDTITKTNLIQAGLQPVVQFFADPLVNCAWDVINFFDQSSSFANRWFWEFGDGGTSTLQNPSYTYQDTGKFDVTLHVFHNGCETVLTKVEYITILPPIAKLNMIRDCSDPYTVQFLDVSIAADTLWWKFGDSLSYYDSSRVRDPFYTFPGRGQFKVELVVYNDTTDCYDTTAQNIIISDPEAIFNLTPLDGCAPLDVSTQNLSVDADSFYWSTIFGQVDTATLFEPSFRFEQEGTYSGIQLIVKDQFGCLDTTVSSDQIKVFDVHANFGRNSNGGCTPTIVNFTDSSQSSLSPIVKWDWDFGDGGSDTVQNPTYTYVNKGLYSVTLIATNAEGCSDTLRYGSIIQATNPQAQFELDTLLCVGQELSVRDISLGVSLSSFWDFGDGDTSSQINPTHFYTSEGTYSVCLTVTDINGCMSTVCHDVQVSNPIADFTADKTFASCPPLTVQFTNLSANSSSWLWDFGDSSGQSTLKDPVNIYTKPGSYTVCLYATSASGCVDTLCKIQYINVQGPDANWSFTPTLGCAPLAVSFNAVGVNVERYIWDMGNGDVFTQNVNTGSTQLSYTYTTPGSYYPQLIVEDNVGCQRVLTSPDPVVVHGLTVDFLAQNQLLCQIDTAQFLSLVTSTLPVQNFQWTFPGGSPNSSSSANQDVFYSQYGIYDVKLRVDNGVCMDSIIKLNYITVAPTPQVSFVPNPRIGCSPLVVAFDNTSSIQNGSIAKWNWKFTADDSSTLFEPGFNFNDIGQNTIVLEATSDVGCISSFSDTVHVLESPEAIPDPVDSICVGEYTTLSTASADFYKWTPNLYMECDTCQTTLINPPTTTKYYITVESQNGCTDTDSVIVPVRPYPIPDAQLVGDTIACEADFVQLFASGGFSPTHYRWDTTRKGLSCYDGCFNPFAFPEEPTTYVVTVIGEGGCLAYDSIRVNIVSLAQNVAGPDRTICLGESVTLSSGSLTQPTWRPFDAGLSCINCPNPVASPTVSTTYTLHGIDSNGCDVRDTLTVNIFDPEDVNAGPNLAVCRGESIELQAQATGVFQWTAHPTLSDTLALRPIVSPTDTTTYYLTASNDLCIVIDSVTVFVVDRADITAQGGAICEGDTVQLFASGLASSYAWTPAENISNASIAEPFVWPNKTTRYIVTGSLGNCPADTAHAIVEVIEARSIYASGGGIFYPNQVVQLGVNGTNPRDVIRWYPSTGLSCTDCPNPTVQPDTNAIYYVEVTTPEGCISNAQATLLLRTQCEGDPIVIPNAFTPNNDGENDFLYVRGIADINIFRVFSRNGECVFQTEDVTQGWDGKFKNEDMNPGVFVYYVEAPCPISGEPFFIKGNVTLIR